MMCKKYLVGFVILACSLIANAEKYETKLFLLTGSIQAKNGKLLFQPNGNVIRYDAAFQTKNYSSDAFFDKWASVNHSIIPTANIICLNKNKTIEKISIDHPTRRNNTWTFDVIGIGRSQQWSCPYAGLAVTMSHTSAEVKQGETCDVATLRTKTSTAPDSDSLENQDSDNDNDG